MVNALTSTYSHCSDVYLSYQKLCNVFTELNDCFSSYAETKDVFSITPIQTTKGVTHLFKQFLESLKNAMSLADYELESSEEPINKQAIWFSILPLISKLQNLIYIWATENRSQTPTELNIEFIFVEHPFFWSISLNFFAQLLKDIGLKTKQSLDEAAALPLGSSVSSKPSIFWFCILEKLIRSIDLSLLYSSWKKLYLYGSAGEKDDEKTLQPFLSLTQHFFSIPAFVSNINNKGQLNKMAISNLEFYSTHFGAQVGKWLFLELTFEQPLDKTTIIVNILNKVHRAGYLANFTVGFYQEGYSILSSSNLIEKHETTFFDKLFTHPSSHMVWKPLLIASCKASYKIEDSGKFFGFRSIGTSDPVLVALLRPFIIENRYAELIRLITDSKLELSYPAVIAKAILWILDRSKNKEEDYFQFLLTLAKDGNWTWSRKRQKNSLEASKMMIYLIAHVAKYAPVQSVSRLVLSRAFEYEVLQLLNVSDNEIRALGLTLVDFLFDQLGESPEINKPSFKDESPCQAVFDFCEFLGTPKINNELSTIVHRPDFQIHSNPHDLDIATQALDELDLAAPRYLDECLGYLKSTDDDSSFIKGMEALPELIRKADTGTLTQIGPALAKFLVHLSNPSTKMENFELHRSFCLKLLISLAFGAVSQPLVSLFYDNTLSFHSQIILLEAFQHAVIGFASDVPQLDSSASVSSLNPLTSGKTVWRSAALINRPLTAPVGKRALIPTHLFFPLIKPLKISAREANYDQVILLESILKALGAAINASTGLPEFDVMSEVLISILKHLHLHPDPRIQLAVLASYLSSIPDCPSTHWASFDKLPQIMAYCHDMRSCPSTPKVYALSGALGRKIAKILEI